MLRAIDELWMDHLLGMDQLKEGVGLRGYGQMDPLKEYSERGVWYVRLHDRRN